MKLHTKCMAGHATVQDHYVFVCRSAVCSPVILTSL